MALIAEEHPKFLDTPNPKQRLDSWAEAFESVPNELARGAVKLMLADSPYPPKFYDVVQCIKGAATANNAYPITDWDIRSWKCAHEELGVGLPPEIMRLVYGEGHLLDADVERLGVE